MNKTIQFIVIAYEPKETFFALLQSLGEAPVVIVDNTEKKSQTLNVKLQSSQRIIRNNQNLGYSGGVNVGIHYALAHDVQWIVVVNQDLHITEHAIRKLQEALEYANPGIIGPFAGKLDKKRWTTILPSKKVDYISGSCMAIHRTVIERIGYFYEPYFMYYEDADFCVRARKAGFPIIHLPIAGITHDDATSLGRGSFLHQYYLAHNHLLFVERNAPVSVKIHEVVRLPKTIWEHLGEKEWGALAGIRDYFLRRFGKYKPL